MKDRVFLDTNVVLDLLGEREPFYESAAKIATLADKGEIQIVVSALSYSTVFYVLSKFEGKTVAKDKIIKFKTLTTTADLTDKIIETSLAASFVDFEDALQHYCAVASECSLLITRNGKDFKAAHIPILTPDEYLKSYRNKL